MRTAPETEIEFAEPMECLAIGALPEGDDWTYEVKLDGFRAQALCRGAGVSLLSRTGKSFNTQFAPVVRALASMPRDSVFDGELVALDEAGRPSFNLLQNHHSVRPRVVYYVFDLLYLKGVDLRSLPLRERRELLRSVFVRREEVDLCEAFDLSAAAMLALVREHQLEGVVAKRTGSCYEAGRRSGAWKKYRVNLGQEFVIGGYTRGSAGFDALVIGFYRNGKLLYCSRVRAGFVPASRREVFAALRPLEAAECPFGNLPQASAGRWGQGLTAEKMLDCVWVKPELVGRFEFLEWTAGDQLRHTKFMGLRTDKPALSVTKESDSVVTR